jgi:ABC-type transport system involved in multi-copper enzyme maturation permease subunit
VISLWQNPEFIRNCRAQLRPRRLVLVASIVGALSLVVGYSMAQAQPTGRIWGDQFLTLTLYAQIFTLFLGGGVVCSRAISQERDQNTFDFQRVTQLTSLELAIGKLFGAPAVSYFATFCMFPAALAGAVAADTPIDRILAAYLIIFIGAIAFHGVMLLFSLCASKTVGGISGVFGGGLLFVILMILSIPGASHTVLDLGPLGPGAAVEFARHGGWNVYTGSERASGYTYAGSPWTDVFFGVPIHHLPVLLVLYVTFAAWCLLPLARNLKRDPALLELFSPGQSVGLLAYINVILVGFFRLRPVYGGVLPPSTSSITAHEYPLSTAFSFFLTVNLTLLYCLGLALLHNREQTRRRVHQRDASGFDWQEAAWPAVYILAGAACAAVLFLARFGLSGGIANDLDLGFALFACALLLATLLRDLCFLQWMNLRRAKRPLMQGVILLGVFYFCGSILLLMARFSKPIHTAFMAIVAPWGLATAGAPERLQWSLFPGPWIVGLAIQIALVVFFAAQHYKSAEELRPVPTAAPAKAAVVGD